MNSNKIITIPLAMSLFFLSFSAFAKQSYVLWMLGQNESDQIAVISETISALQNPEYLRDSVKIRQAGEIPLPTLKFPHLHSNPGEISESKLKNNIRQIISDDGILKAYIYEVNDNLSLTFAIPGQSSAPTESQSHYIFKITEALSTLGFDKITHQSSLLLNLDLDTLQAGEPTGYFSNWFSSSTKDTSNITQQTLAIKNTIDIIRQVGGTLLPSRVLLLPSQQSLLSEESLSEISKINQLTSNKRIQNDVLKAIKDVIVDVEGNHIHFGITDWTLLYDSNKNAVSGFTSLLSSKQTYQSSADIILNSIRHIMLPIQKHSPLPIMYRDEINKVFENTNLSFKDSYKSYSEAKNVLSKETRKIQSLTSDLETKITHIENGNKHTVIGKHSNVEILKFEDASDPKIIKARFSSQKQFDKLQYSPLLLNFGVNNKGIAGAKIVDHNVPFHVNQSTPVFLSQSDSGFYTKNRQLRQFQSFNTQISDNPKNEYEIRFEVVIDNENKIGDGIFDDATDNYMNFHYRGKIGELFSTGEAFEIKNESFESRPQSSSVIELQSDTIIMDNKRGIFNAIEFHINEGLSDKLSIACKDLENKKSNTAKQLAKLETMEDSFGIDLERFTLSSDELAFNNLRAFKSEQDFNLPKINAETAVQDYENLKTKFRIYQDKFSKIKIEDRASSISTEEFTSKNDIYELVSGDTTNILLDVLDAIESGDLISQFTNRGITYIATDEKIIHNLMNLILIPKYHKIGCLECSSPEEFQENFKVSHRKIDPRNDVNRYDTREISIAVIGPTDSGKSTFVNTLNHFASTISVDALELIDNSPSTLNYTDEADIQDSWTEIYLPSDNFFSGNLRAQTPAAYCDNNRCVKLNKPTKEQFSSTSRKGEIIDSYCTTREDISPAYRIKSLDTKGYLIRNDALSFQSYNDAWHLKTLKRMNESLNALILVVDAQQLISKDHTYLTALYRDIENLNKIRNNNMNILTVFTHIDEISSTLIEDIKFIMDELLNQQYSNNQNKHFFFSFRGIWGSNQIISKDDYASNLHESIRIIESIRRNNQSFSTSDYLKKYNDLIKGRKTKMTVNFGDGLITVEKTHKQKPNHNQETNNNEDIDNSEELNKKSTFSLKNDSETQLQVLNLSLNENGQPEIQAEKIFHLDTNDNENKHERYKDLHIDSELDKFKSWKYNQIGQNLKSFMQENKKDFFNEKLEKRDLFIISKTGSTKLSVNSWYKSWYGKLIDQSIEYDFDINHLLDECVKDLVVTDANTSYDECELKEHNFIVLVARTSIVHPLTRKVSTNFKVVEVMVDNEENIQIFGTSKYLF